MNRRAIRTLKPSESDPPGEPKRYVNGGGYTRLRWKLGKGEYVERYLRDEAGSLVRDRPSEVLYVDYQLAKALYEDGWSTVRIAAELCCDTSVLSRRLRVLGVEMRTKKDYDVPLDVDEASRRYQEEQIGVSDLARDLGVSEVRLGDELRKRGVTRRPGTPKKRQNGNAYDTVFKRMRSLILERSAGLCEIGTERCTGQATVVHHRKRRSQGGENTAANLTAACAPCHRYIHNHPGISYKNGWLVKSTDDPAEIEVSRNPLTFPEG